MSYIHKALNKAQRDKDTLNQEYEGLLSPRGKRRGLFSLKGALWISVILCAGAVGYYLWFFPKAHPPADVKEEKTDKPLPTPAHKRPAETASMPGKEVMTKTKVNPKVLYEKARGLYKRGSINEAKQLYENVIKTNPNYPDALNNLGVIYMHEKNYEAAESSFNKVIAIRPGYVDPYYNLACVCAMKGEKEKGIDHLKKAISLNREVIDWARADADLQNLKGMPEFETLIKPN
ncbi:putative Tetratricopeptide repeat protein [uncultured Desulfobacterium sp.]|uniref:Putative Tetratricopeptide repeat protein n=1 Tax=uncultured Desulfobacterium sp. TaxID=201089 RepID=A0A445MSN0_9BACT|nr:putative Tetratricopeptide repeat protein [uncultured Desulfobacterium sp.]